MPIKIAKSAGFCMGVNRAVNTALKVAEDAQSRKIKAYSLGELIHNPSVVSVLQKKGLSPVAAPEEAKDCVLVIRSHGVSREVLEKCRALAAQTVDCTCPFVHHVHQLVSNHSKDGSSVLILGDQKHPEIRGIVGWCEAESHVIQSEEDISSLPDSLKNPLLVSQTTFPPATFSLLLSKLLLRYPGLQYENTICKATSERQTEAEELSRICDKMIVIGGKHSANTRKLAETCRKHCPETYLVEGLEELRLLSLDPQNEMIGITAGASTPAWSLKEVVNFMNDKELMENQNTQELAEEVVETANDTVDTAAAEAEKVEETAAEAEKVEETAAEAEQVEETAAEAEKVEETAAEAEKVEETAVEAEKVEETAAEEKAEEVPEQQEPAKEPSFMDAVAASMSRIRTGQTITGKVVQLTDDEVCVNIGYKSDGLLKRDELVDKDVNLGDEIEVEVVKVNDGEGNVILSQRNIVNRKVWAELMEKYEKGELVAAVGKEAVKGGLLANVEGVRAFIPASHLAQRYVDKISQFVGQDMKLKIIEVDQSKKRIVASRKEALAQEQAAIKEAVWAQLEEGAVVRGIVRRFTNFGAFVDLGGVDGLIHVSDLSWNRSAVPSDILKTNQEVDVKILSLDRERDRIALGYKQLQPRPWDNIEEKYPVGTILTRTIVRVRPFGAFIELEPGVDGLVHISQISHTRVEKIEDVVQPGQEVNVKVLSVDPAAKRISLSIREAMERPAATYNAAENAETASHAAAEGTPALSSAPAVAEDRPETALELAMRKAREAQENE
ncbi:MAG: bifunctional 4-hydroxy-3-methylbut-2-enyl diphosphate reductase/30S ribosomal protein S1 [Bacillota bacterium]|nr:bifunctional 4-hydroxy-3-methylbut-2-enyl diphosphate reductase/30S ribosomal protein S1 [Bacillota bacterium]